jgi:hypothetical protein
MRRMLGLGVLAGREAMCWARRPVRAEPEVPAPLDGLIVSFVEGEGVFWDRGGVPDYVVVFIVTGGEGFEWHLCSDFCAY